MVPKDPKSFNKQDGLIPNMIPKGLSGFPTKKYMHFKFVSKFRILRPVPIWKRKNFDLQKRQLSHAESQ